MDKKKLSAVLLAGLLAASSLAACTRRESGGNGVGPDDPPTPVLGNVTLSSTQYENYKKVDNTNYNKALYYLNELKFEIADPHVIYIDHGEEAGYFYAYGTSDLVNCHGIQCWRSKDLTNWEYKSVALEPDFDVTWAFTNYWAPEAYYDAELDKYLLFYNADYLDKRSNPTTDDAKYMSVAFADEPYGPFTEFEPEKPAYDFSSDNDRIPKELARSTVIDAHPFVDPVSGNKYLYYSGYGLDGNKNSHPQTILGVEMEDWLHPKYETVKELTRFGNTTTDRSDNDISEGDNVNEGPYMWYEDGTYYLTFSTYAYYNASYQVRQALSDSPLGDFTKVQPEEGGSVLVTDVAWGTIVSAGHHCFIKCGDELMIAYHTFKNRSDITGGRALAVDRVSFVENGDGVKLMHADGPTYSYQPLPSEVSGYDNLAPEATITCNNAADGADVSVLNDEVLKIHGGDAVKEFPVKNGSTTFTVTFPDYVSIRSIMIYNSIEFDKAFWGIDNIRMQYKNSATTSAIATVGNVPFDSEWHSDGSKTIFPGANSIVEVDDIPVKSFTFSIYYKPDDYPDGAALGDIVVLGKHLDSAKPVKEFKAYTYEKIGDVQFLPVYESETFGSAADGKFKSNYGYDLSHDIGGENYTEGDDWYVDKYWTGNGQELYFKDLYATDFYVETDVSVLDHTRNYEGDEFPKFGFMMKTSTNRFAFYHIVADKDFVGQNVGYVLSNAAGSDYDWKNSHVMSPVPGGLNYKGKDKSGAYNFAKLALARRGDDFYMYANDHLIFHVDTNELANFKDQKVAVSLLTYNCFVRFKNYSVLTDAAAIDEKIDALGGV